jgi:hypothetical protein
MKNREQVYFWFDKGDKLKINEHQSDPGKGLTYPTFVGTALECGGAGGWDVYDIQPDDSYAELADEEGVISVYGFSLEKI